MAAVGSRVARVRLKRSVAPEAPPPSDADVQAVEQFLLNARRTLLLAGAGTSTESGVPDYRSPDGAYAKGHRPMRDHEFRRSEMNRRRYWARSFLGWKDISRSAVPNQAHRSTATLVQNGWASGLLTQNVDRLDLRAGTPPDRLLELHGTTHEVFCLHCGSTECRHNLQDRLKQRNPMLLQEPSGGLDPRRLQRPDGDAEIGYIDYTQLDIPPCLECGGTLMPNVVFFGGNVPKEKVEASRSMIDNADRVLVLGSSLQTWSSYRLARQASLEGKPIGIVNIGETRADPLANMQVRARVGEVLGRLLHECSPLAMPRGMNGALATA